ncbi:class I SAM-dependent methyltransferase [Reyranella sp.]|uniref:class I SAM-dependent methyltransferase n=1 Tax=Reyranella sp. TaxID=1929291 RepID=UPI00120F8B58|nr:class I SAM-dependent methyltransferase [Reyranella sp.]TAJ90442.1 MAG: class I SAM-dependent methyltransferase [Reyranella sp.]
MIADAFLWVLNRTPSLRRTLWRVFFDVLAARFGNVGWWTLMNYGYADLDCSTKALTLDPADDAERYPIALYHHVATLAPIADREVLEIGSGRGGGASFVARYLSPARMVGLDLSRQAVKFCNQHHRLANLRFQQGDAERLPFTDASFDSVINVESSFCYPSIDRFLAEVKRVLRAGGHLHYTDLRLAHEVADWRAALARCGLELVAERDITANVIEALHRDTPRRRAGGRRIVSGPFSAIADVFTGVEGTRIPSLLASGEMVYFSFLLRKPATAA